jgi:hypothetical protein
MPLIEPLPAVDFRPCRRICESVFTKNFFSKKFLYGRSVCGARLKASGMAITGTAAGRRKGLEAHKITALTTNARRIADGVSVAETGGP